MRLTLVLALVAACAPASASAPGPVAPRRSALDSESAGAQWRRGARDSAAAVAVACEILRDLAAGAAARDCRVEGYRDTAAEYVLRVREIAEGAGSADAPVSEVRLTKDGLSATLTRIPQP